MTPYTIFAIVLTIAYIIYYGYTISKDLYGKKGQTESSEEEFDVASMKSEVVATPVRETGDGFYLGEEEDNDSPKKKPSESVSQSSADEASTKENHRDNDSGGKNDKINRIIGQMNETEVNSEGGMKYPELEQMMMHRDPVLVFRKSTIKQNREIL